MQDGAFGRAIWLAGVQDVSVHDNYIQRTSSNGIFIQQLNGNNTDAEPSAAIPIHNNLVVDSVGHLKECFGALGRDVNYIIVKNFGVAGKFEVYDQSNVRKDLLAAGAREIAIPALDGAVYQSVDRASIAFSAFATVRTRTLASPNGATAGVGCASASPLSERSLRRFSSRLRDRPLSSECEARSRGLSGRPPLSTRLALIHVDWPEMPALSTRGDSR